MAQTYYTILGVDKNVTLTEIKKAYRQQVKLLHPDVNKDPRAQEQFMLLHEAYEYLHNLKTGKVYSLKKQVYSSSTTSYKSYQDWQERERAGARQRGKQHAQMNHEAFTETAYYKKTTELNLVLDLLNILFVLLVFIGAPLAGFLIKGKAGLFTGILIIFITAPLWASTFTYNKPELTFKDLKKAFILLFQWQKFQLAVAFALNLFLVFRIGLNTMITVLTLTAIFAAVMTIGFFVSIFIKSGFHRSMIYLGIAPGLVNLFLLCNFLFSTNDVSETYTFNHQLQSSSRDWDDDGHIKLKGNKYAEYVGIRLFVDFETMENSGKITYHFADGLFGLRVMKSYEFK